MYNLELLLRKYMNNFLLIKDYSEINNINYLNYKNIITVTDENLINDKEILKIIHLLQTIYSTKLIILPSQEPNYKIIENTSKKIFKNNCDLVVAVGGGSVLDTVKAASMYENSIEKVDNFAGSRKKYSKKLIKTLAIPTTAGTGSEFTKTSVYKTESKIKNWLWDDLTFFDHIIYIPSLTLNMPIDITIASGVDAFDHLIESLISVKFNAQNITLCNEGMEAIWNSLPQLLKNKNNINERTNMLLGSGIAGKAIDLTGCGICHCIAHTLGSLTNVSHGVAVAYALFHTIEAVLTFKPDLSERFQGQLKGLSAILLAKNIKKWISEMNINYQIIEGKVDFDDFIRIYFLDDNKSMRDNTFFQPNKFDLKKMLNNLWKI